MEDKNKICNDIIALIRESYESMEYIGCIPDMYTLIGIIKEYANPTEEVPVDTRKGKQD